MIVIITLSKQKTLRGLACKVPSIPLSASQIACQKRVLSEQLVTAKFLSFVSSHHFVEELKDVILEENAFGLQELFVVIRKTHSIVIIHCHGVPAKLQACFCLCVCRLRVYVCAHVHVSRSSQAIFTQY